MLTTTLSDSDHDVGSTARPIKHMEPARLTGTFHDYTLGVLSHPWCAPLRPPSLRPSPPPLDASHLSRRPVAKVQKSANDAVPYPTFEEIAERSRAEIAALTGKDVALGEEVVRDVEERKMHWVQAVAQIVGGDGGSMWRGLSLVAFASILV